MEVHHHSHHGKKKWTEYFWEFLMLFLAVFCGFLAENIREHSVERHREKEYMQSMIEDLAHDTLQINYISSQNITANKDLDTLNRILRLPLSNNKYNRKRAYDFMLPSMGAETVVFSQRTLSQLKNAGGLRLVRKKEIANLISVYDSKIQYLALITKSLDESTTDASRIASGIFDLNYLRNDHDTAYELISYESEFIKKFSNWAQMVQHIFVYYEEHLQEEKKLAIQLLQLIKKEYHFK